MIALVLLAAAWTVADVVTVVGVITTSLIGIITALATLKNRDQIAGVRKEVTTMNGQTLAMLADATETRRIDKVPEKDRTTMEDEHITSVTDAGLDPEGRDNTAEQLDSVDNVKQ